MQSRPRGSARVSATGPAQPPASLSWYACRVPPVGPRPDPPAGVAKVVYRGTYEGSVWENVFWCKITGTLVYGTIFTFATDMYGVFETNLLPWMSTHATLEECIVTYYDGAGNPQGSATASHAGGRASTTMTAAAAIVISWKIPASWRGGKPRTYLGGQDVGGLANTNEWLDTYVASVQAAAEAFRVAVNGITLTGVTGVQLGTVSFQHLGAWRTPPVHFSYVATGLQQRVCTQRRRLGALIS